MTNIKIVTNKGDYELFNTSMREVKELLKLCRSKRQIVLELTIIKSKG